MIRHAFKYYHYSHDFSVKPLRYFKICLKGICSAFLNLTEYFLVYCNWASEKRYLHIALRYRLSPRLPTSFLKPFTSWRWETNPQKRLNCTDIYLGEGEELKTPGTASLHFFPFCSALQLFSIKEETVHSLNLLLKIAWHAFGSVKSS